MASKQQSGSIWTLAEFQPLAELYEARQRRLRQNEAYYKGKMYDQSYGDMKAWAVQMPVRGLRKQIKVLFQPLAGAVQVDVALIPANWELDADSQQHGDAVRRLLKMSRWGLEQDMYVHQAAAMGMTTLKVVDDRVNGTVVIQPIRPDTVLTVPESQFNSRLRMAIVMGQMPGPDGKPVELAEVIEPDQVRTFVAGEPMGVLARPATFANALGEVGVVDVPFLYTGEAMGEPTFEAAKQPLDGVNQQANDMEENIKKHVEPQWAAFIDNPEKNAADLQKSGDNVWWFPAGSDVKALVANLDIPGVLEYIKEIKLDMKKTLPELLTFELVGMTRIAVPAIEVQLLPLTMKIHRARRSLDDGLARALRLAGRAAGQMGLAEYAGLDDPLLGFAEKRPVVFMDALTALSLEQSRIATDAARMGLEDQRRLTGDG